MARPARSFLTAEWRDVAGVTYACDAGRLTPHLPAGTTVDHLDGEARVSLVAFEFRRTRVLGLPVPGCVRFPEINLRFYVRHRGERAVVFLRELVPRRAVATAARVCVRRGTAVAYRVAHPTWALHEVLDTRLDVDFAGIYGPEWAWLADAVPSHVTLAAGSAVTVSRPRPAWRTASYHPGVPTDETRTPAELIDARIEELGDWRGELLARLRAIVKDADPGVVEEWKWRGVPTWYHDGIVCTGETYKAVVKVTFAKGASLEDPSGLFNASLDGNVRRAIDFHEGDAVHAPALTALIREAVALNEAKATKKR